MPTEAEVKAALLDAKKLQLSIIKQSFASGILVVKHGDTQTTFRTLAEMERIILLLEAEIAELINGLRRTRGPRYIRQTSKGDE